jgi:hypothetical protein
VAGASAIKAVTVAPALIVDAVDADAGPDVCPKNLERESKGLALRRGLLV